MTLPWYHLLAEVPITAFFGLRSGSTTVWKNTHCRPKERKQAVFDEDLLNDVLSSYDWRVAEDLIEDYELLLKGLRMCADAASLSLSRRNDRISSNTKVLLEERERWIRMQPPGVAGIRIPSKMKDRDDSAYTIQ
ncbi:unnamed protein product [Nippostrongylus brasiliensis]|uniref:Uncharacterized protein n=1 Tax=Nippostrongylus brasiliensis TaxID=27835 RepID=A0A0N4XKL6_NIPBR|nr:unnamed protein product [Nippostrongylus brasiliensis]